jgi:heme exporter protein A
MQLHVDRLSCRRGGREVYSDLEFRLGGGAVMALRGPNGVGKSTLLRQLAGLLPVTDGDVALDGVSLRHDPSAFRERVLYAGHLDAVKPALTVADNLGLWRAVMGPGSADIAPVLERFGLAHIAGRPAAECSAGQKRRLGLARLMLVPRPLWLLDEPTVSLDSEGTALVASMIEAHASAGGIAVVATHVDLGIRTLSEFWLHPPAARPAGGGDAPGAETDPFLAGTWQ